MDSIKNVANEAANAVGEVTAGAVQVRSADKEMSNPKDDNTMESQTTKTAGGESSGDELNQNTDSRCQNTRRSSGNDNVQMKNVAIRYKDKSEMEPCVKEVGAYLGGPFLKCCNDSFECHSVNYEFCEQSNCHPWGDMFRYITQSGILSDALERWVVMEGGLPIESGSGAPNKSFEIDLGGGSAAYFRVTAKGDELEDRCVMMLDAMKGVVRKLEIIQKVFSDHNEWYVQHREALHGGVKIEPYKSIHFGETPFKVYTTLKALITGNTDQVKFRTCLGERRVPCC